MSTTSTVLLSSLGLAALAGGAAAWAHYGNVIYFDLLSAGFNGCFF